MKLKDWLETWGLTSLKLKAATLETEWRPKEPDRQAAWSLSIELITRVATQDLPREMGDETSALASISNLFALTRTALKEHYRCDQLARIAIPMLNQRIRPFTAKWHRLATRGAFKKAARCQQFRIELRKLQQELRAYAAALQNLAGMDDRVDW